MRVYVPATPDLLGRWYAAGAVPSTADGFVPPDETEEGEYAALMSAAEAAAALLDGAGRRVVVVVEAPEGPGEPGGPVDGPVGFRDVAAVHADAVERPADADPDEDLGWFGVQEIPTLID